MAKHIAIIDGKEVAYMKKSRLEKVREGGVFKYVNYVILTFFALFCLFPFVNVLLTSFASFGDYINAQILVIPYHFTFEAYAYMFKLGVNPDDFGMGLIPQGFVVTLFVTFAGTLLTVLMTSLAAYPLTKTDLPGKGIISFLIIFTMFFGGGIIPFFVILKTLGFVNRNFTSLFGIILPFCLGAYNIIILRNFFRTVPESVIESAEMDGASEFTVLFRFVIPLSMAGVSTIALFAAVQYWNDWFWPMLVVTDPRYKTLALVLRELLADPMKDPSQLPTDSQLLVETSKMAAIVVSIVPLILIYPFIQKFFEKGIILGAIKE